MLQTPVSGRAKLSLFKMKRSAVVSASKAISSLSLQGKIDCAKKVFDEMPQRDSVAWNLMIRGYVENGRLGEAREVLNEMPYRQVSRGIP